MTHEIYEFPLRTGRPARVQIESEVKTELERLKMKRMKMSIFD